MVVSASSLQIMDFSPHFKVGAQVLTDVRLLVFLLSQTQETPFGRHITKYRFILIICTGVSILLLLCIGI